MDLHNFLEQFIAGDLTQVVIVAALVGGAVFGLIQWLDSILKNGGGTGMAPNLKFWSAVALSFLIPLGAYLIVTIQDAQKPTLNGVFLAAAVGFTAATALHWLTGGSQSATAMHEASIHPNTSVPIEGSNVRVTVHKA